MKFGRLADFFFVGLGIVPVALVFSGLLHLAILLFVPLLFVACLFGMAEQVCENDPAAGAPTDTPGSDSESPSGSRPRLTWRSRIGKK